MLEFTLTTQFMHWESIYLSKHITKLVIFKIGSDRSRYIPNDEFGLKSASDTDINEVGGGFGIEKGIVAHAHGEVL